MRILSVFLIGEFIGNLSLLTSNSMYFLLGLFLKTSINSLFWLAVQGEVAFNLLSLILLYKRIGFIF